MIHKLCLTIKIGTQGYDGPQLDSPLTISEV